jgi:hypothetical protein
VARWLLPLLALLAFAATAALLNRNPIPLRSLEPQIQNAPHVLAKQQSYRAGKAEIAGNNNTHTAQPPSAKIPPLQPEYTKIKPDADAAHSADERTEWWIILGHRLKITDTILAVFTALLFFAAIWQGYQLKLTVRHTSDSVELSRNSFIIENRAYITPIEFTFGKGADIHSGRVIKWLFHPQWRNTGQTPAIRVRHLTNAKVFLKSGMPDDFDFPDNQRIGANMNFGKVIGPSFTFVGPHVEIDAVVLRDLMKSKQYRMFIWGWVEYRDVFPGTPIRRTEWCSELILLADPTNPQMLPISLFRLVPTDRFNHADEDCYRKAGIEAPLVDLTADPVTQRYYMLHAFSMPYPGWPTDMA